MIPLLVLGHHTFSLTLDKLNGPKSSHLSQTSGFSEDLKSVLRPLSAPVPLARALVLFMLQLHAASPTENGFRSPLLQPCSCNCLGPQPVLEAGMTGLT